MRLFQSAIWWIQRAYRPIARTRDCGVSRARPGEGRGLAVSVKFKDPRSRVLWRTGRVQLRGQDKTDLRRDVYGRAQGRCEDERNGKRCNRFAPWDGLQHGELS